MPLNRHKGPLRIGVVSISSSIENPGEYNFATLYEAIGKNTGNLMFTKAMFSVLDGNVTKIGFHFDPAAVNKECDIVVVPAANWLNSNADWDWLTERLEQLKVPIVVIGLGLQASTMNIEDAVVTESALQLARLFSRRAPLISVRGEQTRKFLAQHGINNVVTTGCPSLFMNIFQSDCGTASSDVVLQSTRYGITPGFAKSPGINRKIFALSTSLQMPMIYQSEKEEMEILTFRQAMEVVEKTTLANLLAAYCLSTPVQLHHYLQEKGRVFYNLHDWSIFVRQSMGVLGTRLHGAILALNSGRPAVLIPHDSRTAEMADFAGIPAANGSDIMDFQTAEQVRDVIRGVDMEKYRDRRSSNQAIFVRFLRECGLTERAENMF